MGGGPAGCAAATLLARWGHAVTLLTKPSARDADLGESIPPSTHKLLDLIGVRAAIDDAAVVRSTGNTIWWGSGTPRVEWFAPAARGWQVTRHALAQVLLDHARGAGAVVEVGHADMADVERRGAPFVLDCTGRTGLLARGRGLRRYDALFRTVAMAGVWRHAGGFDLDDPSHTLIESYDGGWAWSVPRSPEERFVAVMIDPRLSGLSSQKPGSAGAARYREQLGRTTRLARLIADATLIGEPAGWDASMYDASRYTDDNVLLVGDAASFLDPLSSAGVKKALASGWLAAVAVHTALCRPAMRDTALAFYAAREAEVYASFRAMTERFFAEAAAAHPHPFWTDRGDDPAPPTARARLDAALAQLRESPHFRVARGRRVHVGLRPAVCDRGRAAGGAQEIVMEPRLVSGDGDPGVRFAFGVDLLALVDLAPVYASVPACFAGYNQRHPPVTMPDFLAALATALAQDWLEWV